MSENSSYSPSSIMLICVGVLGVILLGVFMVTSNSFPSFHEFVASSTISVSTSTLESLGLSTRDATSTVILSDTGSLKTTYSTSTIGAPKGKINVEVSDTANKQELGLGGRAFLPIDAGMLFIFDRPNIQSFWMKDMHFPIDILWVDSNKRVVGIVRSLSPESFPNSVSSSQPVKYVLELNADASQSFGITIGTSLKF